MQNTFVAHEFTTIVAAYLYRRGTAVPLEVDGRILDGLLLLGHRDLRLRDQQLVTRCCDQMVMTIPRRGDDLEVGVVGLALGQRLERRPQELHAAVAE